MKTIATHAPATHSASPMETIRAWIEMRQRERAYRRSMKQLGDLDDYMLKDIGLTRGEIENAVRRGRR